MELEELDESCNRTANQKYIKFISDEGWKYETEEELAAGYARMVKAEQGSPLTWKEFWAELRMDDDSTAAQKLYRRLRRLMENGALSAYQLYGYARHKWCVRCPEAVAAYQIGPKRWAVNNCGEAISEDRAQLLLNSRWGLEAGRIKLPGIPHCDAADWNFICFHCGPYDWLMRNRTLHKIYQQPLFRRPALLGRAVCAL
jgi:hypothetical protein